ncbi:MAG: hypothetical protein JWQ09_874 [Segetibacter sp.]|nr:hypothetical protein [Segetibacter sp.]
MGSLHAKIVMQNRDEVKQHMFAHIEHWKQSRISQKQYCLQNEIAYHSFHYWLKRFKNNNDQKPAAFIELQVQTGQPCIEVLFADGKLSCFINRLAVFI